jgi:hypothetical protein
MYRQEHLMLWCVKSARYTIPTIELIDFLKARIGNRKAIEIGSGNNDLGWYLGIPQTDSYIQQTEAMKTLYSALGQVPTSPKPDVEKLDAIAAIKKYQ